MRNGKWLRLVFFGAAILTLVPMAGAQTGNERNPVVLVHGLAGSSASLDRIGEALRQEGRQVYAMGFPSEDLSIRDVGAALGSVIQQAARRSPTGRVDVIAHSMGGLALRAYLQDYSRHGYAQHAVERAVTIATPHGGSSSAYLVAGDRNAESRLSSSEVRAARQGQSFLRRTWGTRAIADLRPNSELIRSLPSAPPADVIATSFGAENDIVVLPAESARWPGASSFERLPGDHSSVLNEAETIRQVSTALQRRLPSSGQQAASPITPVPNIVGSWRSRTTTAYPYPLPTITVTMTITFREDGIFEQHAEGGSGAPIDERGTWSWVDRQRGIFRAVGGGRAQDYSVSPDGRRIDFGGGIVATRQ